MAKQPKSIDVNDMSLEELKSLQNDLTKAIASFEERRRKEALVAVESKAREMGFSLSDLAGGKKKSGKAAVAPKYQHPENPTLTWSGRGRQPKWFKEGIESGKSVDDFLIK